MANGTEMKVGVDDIVASATMGVMRAFDARKVQLEGTRFTDLVASGFQVRFEIWAGGRIDPDIFGPRGPAGGGFVAGGGG